MKAWNLADGSDIFSVAAAGAPETEMLTVPVDAVDAKYTDNVDLDIDIQPEPPIGSFADQKEAVEDIYLNYQAGRADETAAQAALIDAGIAPEKADQLITVWKHKNRPTS
jgi:hypothetical protein